MQGNGLKLVYKLTFVTSHSSSYLVLCKAVHRPGVYVCHCPDTLTNVHVVDLKCLVGTAHQNYVFKTVRLVTWCSPYFGQLIIHHFVVLTKVYRATTLFLTCKASWLCKHTHSHKTRLLNYGIFFWVGYKSGSHWHRMWQWWSGQTAFRRTSQACTVSWTDT